MPTVGNIQFLISANSLDYQRKMAAANVAMQKLGITAKTVSAQTAAIGPAAVGAAQKAITGFTRLERVFKRVRTVVASVTVSLITIAGFAALGKLAIAAGEFESAFAGVQKTVEATAPELAKLRDEIRQMAKEIPLTTTELSKIGEVGGQLGIGVQNMGRFIEIIAKLGVATTMTIDDAAMSMARFAAIMRTSEEDYERLASTLVHLGNNFAATEQEIMTMSLRIAGAGKQVGMTEDQVLSLATALTAVGIRAEAGGTAISRTMIEIDKQVAIAGDRLSQFAEVAGLGVTQFAQLWKKDAMAALQLFIVGLSKLEERGGNASIVLQELGLGAVRVSDTLRRASSAHALLNETLKFGAEGWRENVALQREAEIRFATMESQLKILINRITDLAISVGDAVLPPILLLIKAFVSLIEVIASLKPLLEIALIGGLMKLVKMVLPALIAGFGKVWFTIKNLSTGILLLSKQTAVLMALEQAQIALRQAESAQIVALGQYNIALAAAQMGNVASRQALAAATTQLTAANAATVKATMAYAAATKAAATATLTWSAALKTILPLLLVYAGYVVVKNLVQQVIATNKASEAISTLREELEKYKESVGKAGIEVAGLGERQAQLYGGMWGYSLGVENAATETKEYAKTLAETVEELKALATALDTGIGTFEQYYTIITKSADPVEALQDMQRKLYESLKELRNGGESWNQIAGENKEAIESLLQISFLYGQENTALAEALQEVINQFNAEQYAAENLEDALSVLDETQRKLYDSITATLNPLKKFEDEINTIVEINKKLAGTGLGIDLNAYYKANAKAIVDAAKKQREFGVALTETQLQMVATAKTFLTLTDTTNKYVDAFKKSLNPTIELGDKLRALKAYGYDASTMARVLGKEIIKTSDDARKFNQTVDKSVEELEDLARALVPPALELQKLDFQMISTAESQEGLSRITAQLVPEMGDLEEAFRYLGLEAKHAKAPIDALSESLERGWVMELDRLTMLPEVVAGQIDKMSAAGLNASQIMHLFGGSIKEAAEWLILLDRPLTEAEQDIVDLAAAATDTSKIIQKQVSTIITDLGKGFADIIVEWQGMWQSLKDIAKDFAKGILRIFFESLFTPIMQGFSSILSGDGFMGGFKSAGGFGGIKGLFGAIGGLFSKGASAGTAGFGGFTDAAAGMTMMDTAATGATTGIGALTGGLGKLGAAAAKAGGWMWQFISGASAAGPWGTAIAAAAVAAVVLWKTVFSKSAYEKFAQEFARDFGDIVISDDAIKNFANSLGVTEEQLAKVRKDVASSPAFLMIGYNAAVAQGKVDQFLKSLESIETAWGTFDFREAFEEGLASGNWMDLNDAFVEAFGSDLLKEIFGEDLKGLLIEMDEEMIELILRTRELQGALETLRDEPVRVAAALDTMTSSIQILRDAGATDAEVMKILGEDIEIVVAAAHELGIAIPPVIQELLALDLATTGVSEAFQEGYHMWGNIVDQGKNLSDTIMGLGARMLELFDVAEAQEMTWKLLGGDILSLANSYTELGIEIPPIIQLTLDWAVANGHAEKSADGLYTSIGKLSAAYQEGQAIWQNFIQDGKDLEQTLLGLGDELLKTYEVAEAQRIAWQFLGDDIIALANSYDGIVDVLPPVIQLALEWAEAAGLIERNAEGAWVAVEGLTDALGGLNEQQVKGLDAWNDMLTTTQDLADFMEGWMTGAIGSLDLDLSNVDDQTQLALLAWNEFGKQAISDANDMISKGLGQFIDARTLQMLEWARYMGLVTQTANGMWQAIEGPGTTPQVADWLQNWAAQMDAIYGPEWREWGKDYHGIDWSGTAPTGQGGDIPEFPFPDPSDYPISETAELSTRMGELKDVLRELVGLFQVLTNSLLGLGETARAIILDPTIGGLPTDVPPPLTTDPWTPPDVGDWIPTGTAPGPPLGPGLPSDPNSPFIPPDGYWDGSGLPVAHTGIDYVPQDMVAMLQKGERVVPANENKAGGSQASGVNVNVIIQGPVYGLDDLDRKIANSVRKTFKAGGLSFLGDS